MFGCFSLFPLVWRVFKSFWKEKHKIFGNFGIYFPCAHRQNPRQGMYPSVLHATAQFVLKIEKLTRIIGTALIQEKALLRSPSLINGYSSVTRMVCICVSLVYSYVLVCIRRLLVCYSYVFACYSSVTRMYLHVTRMYPYVTRMYSCGI